MPGDAGIIEHAQLTPNGGMIMLEPVRNAPLDELQKTPRVTGDVVTQSLCIVVEDVDGHFRAAIAARAEVIMAPEDQSYGGRLYSCRDPEGHLWHFGSYDP